MASGLTAAWPAGLSLGRGEAPLGGPQLSRRPPMRSCTPAALRLLFAKNPHRQEKQMWETMKKKDGETGSGVIPSWPFF